MKNSIHRLLAGEGYTHKDLIIRYVSWGRPDLFYPWLSTGPELEQLGDIAAAHNNLHSGDLETVVKSFLQARVRRRPTEQN